MAPPPPPYAPGYAPHEFTSGLTFAVVTGATFGIIAAGLCTAFLQNGGHRFLRALCVGSWLRCSRHGKVGITTTKTVRYELETSKYGTRTLAFGSYAFAPGYPGTAEEGAAWTVTVDEFVAGRGNFAKWSAVTKALDPAITKVPLTVLYDDREPRRHFLSAELSWRGLCQLLCCPRELNGPGGVLWLLLGVACVVVPFTVKGFHENPTIRLLWGVLTLSFCLVTLGLCNVGCYSSTRQCCTELLCARTHPESGAKGFFFNNVTRAGLPAGKKDAPPV
jgi:hypothetical protein